MDVPSRQIRRVLSGLLLAVAVAFGTAKVQAMAAGCGTFYGGCFVVYTSCEACDGGGCDMVGVKCDGACWYCGSDDRGCQQ